MNELEFEHRLTEVEQRSKGNTRRIENLENIVDEIHTLSKTMVQLVEEVKHTNETVNSLDAKVDRMDSRVDEMEKAPGKKWGNVKDTVLNTIIGAVLGVLMAGIIWAAVQAFQI